MFESKLKQIGAATAIFSSMVMPALPPAILSYLREAPAARQGQKEESEKLQVVTLQNATWLSNDVRTKLSEKFRRDQQFDADKNSKGVTYPMSNTATLVRDLKSGSYTLQVKPNSTESVTIASSSPEVTKLVFKDKSDYTETFKLPSGYKASWVRDDKSGVAFSSIYSEKKDSKSGLPEFVINTQIAHPFEYHFSSKDIPQVFQKGSYTMYKSKDGIISQSTDIYLKHRTDVDGFISRALQLVQEFDKNSR